VRTVAAEALVDDVFLHWIEAHDVVQQVLALDRDLMVDRDDVSFRLSVHTPDGQHLVEQRGLPDGGRRPDLLAADDVLRLPEGGLRWSRPVSPS
jgi:hypothetical protein